METRESQINQIRSFFEQLDDGEGRLLTPPRIPLAGKNPNLCDRSNASTQDLKVSRFEINRPPPVPINPKSVISKWKRNDSCFDGKYVRSGSQTPCTPAMARTESIEFDCPAINRNREPYDPPLPSLGKYCSSYDE